MKLKKLRSLCEELIDNGFECKRCGGCCGVVLMTRLEAIMIREYLIKNNISINITSSLDKLKEVVKTNDVNKANCQLLNEDNKCLIYPERPIVCRIVPFVERTKCEQGYKGSIKAPMWIELYKRNELKFYDEWMKEL